MAQMQSGVSSSHSVRPESPSSESAPPEFPRAELFNALQEQCFGITSFEILESRSDSHEAIARVVLLEGVIVVVSLTPSGYKLIPESDAETGFSPSLSEHHFESVEGLLMALSTRYAEALHNILMSKLSTL